MIGFLSGKIISSKPTQIILDVNGVGYIVNVSISTFEKITGKDVISLYIHTHVREDQFTLFGFYSEAEKEMFEALISVSGIGPKSAQTILSGITVEDLRFAIQTQNLSRLKSIPGIGQKTAERIIVELKSKVENLFVSETFICDTNIRTEAISALTTLGYNVKIAEKAIREIVATDAECSLEDLIRKALTILNK
jgi:Holliday junction DNA helicase RuvA